ncbi:MAG: hypothetical protein LN567_06315 [Rickettsia endosymbiont of Graphium doson]|nr:hypothetical protein [Rickettsia endosymbiont of Graphium doson]
MKLRIRFFANLYNFLIEDYPLQPNKENIIKLSKSLFKNSAEVNFLLKNIHILDLPDLKLSRVQAIKEILKLYLLKSDILNISIPKFEYQIKQDDFHGKDLILIEKVLQPPIKECETHYFLFKDYSLPESNTLIDKGRNLLLFNFKLNEFVKLLYFINQFLCIGCSKINDCTLYIVSTFYDEEDLKILLDTEIDIELNYSSKINNDGYKNIDSFINSKQVVYNRFLVLYHEAFKSFNIKELNILFNICSNNHHLTKSLITCSNPLTLETCTNNIKKLIYTYKPTEPLKTLIRVVPNYKQLLILYKDLFDNKLILKQSDLLLNVCNSNKDLVKSLISDRTPLTLEERFSIVTKIINKYEHDLKLIPRLIIQLLNLLAYEKVKPNIKMDINSLIDSLAKNDNIPINWCYPDGITFESSKYCKLLGEDFYA